MINKIEPISAPESLGYLEKKDEKDAKVIAFIKKFTELDGKDGKKMREKLKDLNNIKIDEAGASKIIEILPEKPEEVNKIFTEVSLTEDETNKIIEAVKEFK